MLSRLIFLPAYTDRGLEVRSALTVETVVRVNVSRLSVVHLAPVTSASITLRNVALNTALSVSVAVVVVPAVHLLVLLVVLVRVRVLRVIGVIRIGVVVVTSAALPAVNEREKKYQYCKTGYNNFFHVRFSLFFSANVRLIF